MVARKTVTYKITGPISLGDLRHLVSNLENADGNAVVKVKEYKSFSPVEYQQSEISVTITEPL